MPKSSPRIAALSYQNNFRLNIRRSSNIEVTSYILESVRKLTGKKNYFGGTGRQILERII